MGVDIERLGPAAREQVLKELARRERLANAERRRQRAAVEKTLPGGQGSRLEEEYYRAYIWPKELDGQVARVERHRRFELLPPSEYCGLRLPAAHYTPDFVIEYGNGTVEAVEVKSHFTRTAQRDYIYRRRLFIELIARPKGWIFTEFIEGGG